MLLLGSADAVLAATTATNTAAGPAPIIVKRNKTADDLGIIIGMMIQIGHLEIRVKISASAPPPGRGHGGRRTQAAGGTAAAGAPVAAAVQHGVAAAPIRRRGAKRRRRRAGGMGMGSSMPPSLSGSSSSSSSSAGAAAAAGYADHAAMLTIIAVGAEDSRGEGVAIVARREGRQRRPRWITIRACHCNCRAFAPHESSAKRAHAPPFVAFPALQAKRIRPLPDTCQGRTASPLALLCCLSSSSPRCFGPRIRRLQIYLQIDQKAD